MLQIPLNECMDVNHPAYQRVAPLLKDYNCVIAGGAARQAFLGEGFGSTDIDLYCLAEDGDKPLRKHLAALDKYSEEGIEYAVTYLLEGKDEPDDLIVQVVKKYLGDNIETIFNSFDFTCCQFAIKDDTIYYLPQAAEDAKNKALRSTLNMTFYGEVPTNHRIFKYFEKGYYPVDGDYTEPKIHKVVERYLKRGFSSELSIWGKTLTFDIEL